VNLGNFFKKKLKKNISISYLLTYLQFSVSRWAKVPGPEPNIETLVKFTKKIAKLIEFALEKETFPKFCQFLCWKIARFRHRKNTESDFGVFQSPEARWGQNYYYY
jgi:hypothetical protein